MTGDAIDPSDAAAAIETFIASTVDEAGADGAVVGLSGGIDSATTSALAARALGPDRVTGMVMPGEPTESHEVEDAERHADDFDVPTERVPIGGVVDAVREALPDVAGHREAVGNVRARARMVLMYAEANVDDLLVLGTGNRTEALIGYFTKYGDGAVDVLPIGDLYKEEVRAVAREVGVAEDIVEKTPTAGLWEGQTDEGELGAPYPVIDEILRCLVDEELSVEATAERTGHDAELVERFRGMYERSAHKRAMPPAPGVADRS